MRLRHTLVRIGEDTSEKLDLIPAKVQVIRYDPAQVCLPSLRGLGGGGEAGGADPPMPKAIIDKGIATPGLLAWVVTAKLADALPLYRQERQFARIGVDLSRQALADWMIRPLKRPSPGLRSSTHPGHPALPGVSGRSGNPGGAGFLAPTCGTGVGAGAEELQRCTRPEAGRPPSPGGPDGRPGGGSRPMSRLRAGGHLRARPIPGKQAGYFFPVTLMRW